MKEISRAVIGLPVFVATTLVITAITTPDDSQHRPPPTSGWTVALPTAVALMFFGAAMALLNKLPGRFSPSKPRRVTMLCAAALLTPVLVAAQKVLLTNVSDITTLWLAIPTSILTYTLLVGLVFAGCYQPATTPTPSDNRHAAASNTETVGGVPAHISWRDLAVVPDTDDDTPRQRIGQRLSVAVGITLGLAIPCYSILAAVTNEHRDDYRRELTTCLNWVNDTARSMSATAGLPPEADRERLLNGIETSCYGKAYLPALDAHRDQFAAARSQALDAMNLRGQLRVAAEDQATARMVDALNTLMSDSDTVRQPSLGDTAKGMLGLP